MLEYLHLKNVGPVPEMEMDLAPRLNIITGDNGLGKTFLLDVDWWVLTRTWARHPAMPAPFTAEEVWDMAPLIAAAIEKQQSEASEPGTHCEESKS